MIRWQDVPDVFGEPIDLWMQEITRMRQLVRLWKWLRDGDVKGISTVIEWSQDGNEVRVKWEDEWPKELPLFGRRIPFHGPRRGLLASKNYCEDYFAQMPRGDVLLPAWMELLDGVNEKLTEHAARPQLIFDRGKPLLRIVPVSLISALWFQFSHALDQNRVYQKCEGCGKLFAEGVPVKRGAKVCSDACRARKYRARKLQAKELHKRGLAPGAIARQLGTDIATVKGWPK